MKRSRSRHGSLQYYPRKKARKFTPSVHWKTVSFDSSGLLGFLAYKVGMATALVRDNTDKIMTSKKQIAIPVTVLEAPNMKVLSVRLYKNGVVLKDIVVSNDKELKRKIRVPSSINNLENLPEFDDLRVVLYSLVKQTEIKKTPDIVEVAIRADNKEAKLEYAKKIIGEELGFENFVKAKLVDVRGVTRGKGIQGPVKRFGITLRQHKSEKGIRKVGSIGPWHPAHVMFRVPIAGQMGLNTRVTLNNQVITYGKISEKNINPKSGFKNYGNIKENYIIINGSLQGPAKRELLLTPSYRPTKEQTKRKLEFMEVLGK